MIWNLIWHLCYKKCKRKMFFFLLEADSCMPGFIAQECGEKSMILKQSFKLPSTPAKPCKALQKQSCFMTQKMPQDWTLSRLGSTFQNDWLEGWMSQASRKCLKSLFSEIRLSKRRISPTSFDSKRRKKRLGSLCSHAEAVGTSERVESLCGNGPQTCTFFANCKP